MRPARLGCYIRRSSARGSSLLALALFATAFRVGAAPAAVASSAYAPPPRGTPAPIFRPEVATPLTSIVLNVSSVPSIKNVARIGLNLGMWKSHAAEQFSANVIVNPGFEPLIDRAIVIVKGSNAGGFSDNDPALARAEDFWAGATFQVRTGISAGQSGTIIHSAAAAGMPWFETQATAPPLNPGDAIAITQTQTSGEPFGWSLPASSTGLVAINISDVRPGSPGHSSADLTLRSGAPTELDAYLDALPNSIPGHKFLPVNGYWQLSFWARATVGGPNLEAAFQRFGAKAFLDQRVMLTEAWQLFTFTFNAHDTGPPHPLILQFTASGGPGAAVRIDDVQLERVSDFSHAWRAEVIQNLQALKPGYLRDLQLQFGDTVTNRLAPSFARAPSRWLPDPKNIWSRFFYSIPDLFQLCSQVGAQPWIVLPATLYDEEFTQLGDYLAAAQAFYGFTEIVVEFGNESWNPLFRSGSIPNPVTMAAAADRGFALLRSAAGPTVPLHLIVNGHFAAPLWGSIALANAHEADGVSIAPYFLPALNTNDTLATVLPAIFATADESTYVLSLRSLIGSAKAVDAYELNFITLGGNAPAAQRNPLTAGMVSGAALANRLVAGLKLGLQRQMVFALSGYNFNVSSTLGKVDLFGVTRDLAAAGSFRPTGLVLQLLNRAIAGDYYPAAAFGPGANAIAAAAFKTDQGWSLVITSANPAPTTLAIALPAGSALPALAQTLTGPSLTADNESAVNVKIGPLAISPGLRLTVPPYGIAVVTP